VKLSLYHVQSVDIRALLPVNFDRDEVVVEQPRDLLALEALSLHDMAPTVKECEIGPELKAQSPKIQGT